VVKFFKGWVKLKIRTAAQEFHLITPMVITQLGPIDKIRYKLTYAKLEDAFDEYKVEGEVKRLIEERHK
jgi:hypothetical protein